MMDMMTNEKTLCPVRGHDGQSEDMFTNQWTQRPISIIAQVAHNEQSERIFT